MVCLLWPENCVHETCDGGSPAGRDENGYPRYGGTFCLCSCHGRIKHDVLEPSINEILKKELEMAVDDRNWWKEIAKDSIEMARRFADQRDELQTELDKLRGENHDN